MQTIKFRRAALTILCVAILGACNAGKHESEAVIEPVPTTLARFEVTGNTGAKWYKGNTHTHTTASDGDSPPNVVVKWYKDNGYNFLVVSDHDVLVPPASLADPTNPNFLLIPGEEVSATVNGKLDKPIHISAVNIAGYVARRSESTVVATLQRNVDAVRTAHGVPIVNHPAYYGMIDAAALAQIRNQNLFEIYNGATEGLSEDIWDALLSQGIRIYGVAVDDAHVLKGTFHPRIANPGKGWVSVHAKSLDAGEIMRRMELGDFYASSGVDLDDLTITSTKISLKVRRVGNLTYTTDFIGQGGTLLQQTIGPDAVYVIKGGEKYVRARVTASNGSIAWAQPVFTK